MLKFILVAPLIIVDLIMLIYWALVSLIYWKNCFPFDENGETTPFISSHFLSEKI